MADSALDSHHQSDASRLRLISSTFFNFPGFLVGFGSRGSSDTDSVRSPTSPLDFGFFSSLSNPFGHKSPRSPTPNGQQKKWNGNKVGLGIINLLADETKPTGVVHNSTNGKTIIFGSQVKGFYSGRSKSLPGEYRHLILPEKLAPKPQLGKSNSEVLFGNEGIQFERNPFSNSSPVSSSPNSPWSSKKFCSENRTSSITNVSLSDDGEQHTNDSSETKSSSIAVPIGTGKGLVGSLSAREIELSEDYTCIISYGPNPKTTHVFCDCILECHTNELSNFDTWSELPPEADCPEDSNPFPSDEILIFCSGCKKKLENGNDIYMYSGEKAFCSIDCRSEEIFDDDAEKTYDHNSSNSCAREDLFLAGMPIPM